MKKLLILIFLCSIAFSDEARIYCKDGIIDSVSNAKFTDSMSEGMNDKFSTAYATLFMSRYEVGKAQEVLILELSQIICGRTAIEIIEMASKISSEESEAKFAKVMRDSFNKALEETEKQNSEDKINKAEEITPSDMLNEIRNWYVVEIWNDGFIKMSNYLRRGATDEYSFSDPIDIDLVLRFYNKEIKKLDGYNTYIKNLKG